MEANLSAPRFMASMPFEPGSTIPPPYPHSHTLHSQHSHPPPHLPPQPSPFNVPTGQPFDPSWFANFPPPPPPPPFLQSSRPPFESSAGPIFSQIPFIPQITSTPPQNAVTQPPALQERPPTPTKERAKEAIRSMVRADITYNDLISEGIKTPVLNALFAELNLPLPKPANEPVEDLDPAMERKDRIARLLAAKKGQSAAPSPREPIQPVDSVDTSEAVSRTETPLPVPVKEPTKEAANQQSISGFSIPGLYMTSAEQEEHIPKNTWSRRLEILKEQKAVPLLPESNQAVVVKNSSISLIREQPSESGPEVSFQTANVAEPSPRNVVDEIKSLKRGAESSAGIALPQAKRHMSSTHENGPLSDIDKPADGGVNVVRSKINQNKLKDRMAALKADLLLKNSRKKALQEGMPALDAEIQKTRDRLQANQERLQEVRAEIERKITDLAHLREEEARLNEEASKLQGHLADGETGQQQFSKELTQLNDQILADENESRVSQRTSILSSPIAERTQGSTQPQSVQVASNSFTPTVSDTAMQDHTNSIPEEDIASNEASAKEARGEIPHLGDEHHFEQEKLDDEVEYDTPYASTSYQSADVEVPMPPLSEFTPEVTTQSEMQTEVDSDDDRMSIDENSPAESVGSASMSDSGSDEYEPAVHLDSANSLDDKETEEYEPQEMLSQPQDATIEADNDDYEPSEQINVLNVDSLENVLENEDVTRLPTMDSTAEDIVATTLVPVDEEKETTISLSPKPVLTLDPTAGVSVQEAIDVAPLEPLSNSHSTVPAVPHFVPYSSPLSNMKHFRFNPQFNDIVKNGYRSLTYSHQIDKDVPVCPTELSGTACVDADCEEQHFGKFALSVRSADSKLDDKILVQMSSANHIKDKAQRDKYLIGLKKVIADLRERGVKEFSEVANALATYRRDQAMSESGLVA